MEHQGQLAPAISVYKRIVAEVLDELKKRPETIKGEFSYIDTLERTYPPIYYDVDRWFFPERKKKILEIGTFSGVISLGLKKLGYEVVALDLPEYVSGTELQRRFSEFDIPTLAANLRDGHIPAEDENFDCVVMCEVIEHFNFNPLPVLKEINRVLKPGGLLYLTTPNASHLGARIKLLIARSIHHPIRAFLWQFDPSGNYIVGLHWREYTGSEMKELLELPGLGFKVEQQGFRSPVIPILAKRFAMRFVYMLVPGFRTTQFVFARRISRCSLEFNQTDATH